MTQSQAPPTSADIKAAVRYLEQRQREITKPCPPCGGAPLLPGEMRLCSICNYYVVMRGDPVESEAAGKRLHDLITKTLEKGPTVEYGTD
jgi:hypothetical protein